jgi:hypothetical protein
METKAMNALYGSWMLSIDSDFHGMNPRLDLMMAIRHMRDEARGLCVARHGDVLVEDQFRPTPEAVQELHRLTARTGLLERPLEALPYVDDSDWVHRVTLAYTLNDMSYAWAGFYYLIGFEGRDAEALQRLIKALKAQSPCAEKVM